MNEEPFVKPKKPAMDELREQMLIFLSCSRDIRERLKEHERDARCIRRHVEQSIQTVNKLLSKNEEGI